MSKLIKNAISEQYSSRYEGVDSACVVNLVGLDAISTNRLRGELEQKEIRLQVVKNSLARRALGEGPLGPLVGALEGPCALVVGGGSAIDLAKTLVDARKSYPKLELKLGIIEGDPGLVEVEQLAKMKGKQELLAEIALLLGSPAASLAGCAQGPAGRIAGCVKAIIEKQEDGEA
jgi:large subunit ribosomal protein L10